MPSSFSLPCQTSKHAAEDEPASPASKLLKTSDDFKANFELNKQMLEDLAVEVIEVCRAGVLAGQD